MGTLVCFHAHPDDESIGTAGLMARAAQAGHRVVLVTATRGELGEIMPGVLDDGEQLGLRRSAELWASAETLGVARVEVLGYVDSGMMGESSNGEPWCFWQADVDAAARRLATILSDEAPDAFTIYDDHGGYGHPDHIQVHRVGMRAAELAGVEAVFQGTMNRDHLTRLLQRHRDDGAALPDGVSAMKVPEELPEDMGSPESIITHIVDARSVTATKRTSMLCHPSQMAPDHFMLAMGEDDFTESMGWEWFISSVPGDALGGIITAR